MAPRAYRVLLRLLPRQFREEYRDEMVRVVEEHWVDVRLKRGPWGRAWFWLRQCVAVVRTALEMRYGRGGAARAPTALEGLRMDLRYAARALARRPGFTTVTVLTLGLGIGATTAIYSAVRAVLLRELPYANAERVVALFQTDRETGERADGVSAANIRDLDADARRLSPVSVAEPWSLDVALDGRTETLRTWAVSRGFFEVLGSQALHGRTFTDEEYSTGDSRVVVLGHRAWTGRFGGDPAIVGTSLVLDGVGYRVVGVLPREFKFPDGADAWLPRPFQPRDDPSRAADFMTGVGLLAPGASREEAQAEVDRLAASLAESYPDTNGSVGMALVPLREHLFGDVRTPLLILLAAVGAVLLMACANVAGLMLARGAQRHREYALRGALGASMGRLIRQVTAESMLLALGGCALGIAFTYGGVGVIRALGPDLPRMDELDVDGSVLLFALAMGGLSAFLAGVVPSWKLSRPDVRDALSDGSRGTLGGKSSTKLRGRLVVAEIAGAVVLLISAGLLMKSFAILQDRQLGFEPAGRLAVQVFAYDYDSPEDRQTFLDEAVRRIEAVPGVRGVALTTNLPGATDGTVASIDVEVPFTIFDQAAPPAGQEPVVSVTSVTPDLFEVLGIPLLAGRSFRPSDNGDAPRVVVVNEALARRYLGDRDPIGGRLALLFGRGPQPVEIVGVVADVRPQGPQSEARPEVYRPLAQGGSGSLTFVVESGGDAGALTAAVNQAIWTANPAQAIWGSATLESLMADWLKERRFNLFLLTGFAVVALVLAGVGVYGLASFSVEQRVGELGVRRALGGQSSDILGLVLREGGLLAGVGILLGVLGAVGATRFLRGMLFEVEPTDPATFAVLALAVFAVSAVAAFVPAYRAVRIDPVDALRRE